jgi:hypothetical protein
VPVEPHARVEEERTRWLRAASLWGLAGFAFPFLTPVTNLFARDLQQYLGASAGMSDDELAYRVAFTVVRVPLTAVLAMAIAGMQYGVAPGVRGMARRWLAAAGIAACVAVLIWLPTTLITAQLVGDISRAAVRTPLLMFGAGLLAGLVCATQRRTTRWAIAVPGSFVATGLLAAILGALAGSAL